MWKNKVRAVAILGITGLVAGLSVFMTHAANEASVERFGKDKFNVLEIVPDIAYSEIGYLVEGEEPVDLNKVIKKDSLGSIGNLLGDAITVNAEKEAEYKVIENDTIENLIGYDGEDINVKGYYKKVDKGDWSAIYGEGLTTGYIAKSWENDISQQYPLKCVYKDDKYEYKKIYEVYKNDVFRYDKTKKTYISKKEDIKNKVDISEFDYAYIALEGSDGKAEFVLISDVSTDSYREIQDCKVINGFTYVGKNNGEWNFVQAFDKRLFVYDNKSDTWVYKSEVKNGNTNTYLSLVPANADCGKNTHIKAQAFATLENMTVTKVGYNNNNLLKENVTHKDIDVITRTPETVTVDDIYAANLIYINSGGRSNAGKHEDGTVYGDTRYEQIAKIYLEANPTHKITNEVLYGEKYGDKDEIVSAILQRAIFGTRTIEKDINGLEIIDNPAVVIFDTDIYKSLELNEAANKKTGVKKQYCDGFKNGMYAYTVNDFTKLYICMNMMYPTSFYKNYYFQSENAKVIDIKTIREKNTSINSSGYGKGSQYTTRESFLPRDLSGKWGYKDNWLAMSIDNPDLDAEYVSEHGVLTFKIKNDNFVKSFNKDIIEKTVTTEETFNIQNISKNSISFSDSLNYLVNNQLKSNITKPKLRLLEVEPCESYTTLDWKWRMSGFAPYYLGGLANWYNETDNASYSNYGEKSRRLSSKEFIGLSESVADNYDLVYIGGEINTMPNGKSTDPLRSRTDVRYEMNIGDSITITGDDLMHGNGSKTYIMNILSIYLVNANINTGGKITSDRIWLSKSNNKYINTNIENKKINITAKSVGYFMIEAEVYVNDYTKPKITFSVFVHDDNNKLNIKENTTEKVNSDINLTLDTQWEPGYYEIETSKNNTSSVNRLRTSEYIEVKSNEVFRLDTANGLIVSIIGYDNNKKFIGQYLNMKNGNTISFPNNIKYIRVYIDGDTLPDCGITLINEKQKKFSDIEFRYNDFSRCYSNYYDANVTTKARLKSDLPYYKLTDNTSNNKRFVLTNTGDTPGYISVDPNTTYIFKNAFNYYNKSRWFEPLIYTVKTADMSPDTESTDSFKNHNAFEMSYGFQVTVKTDDHSVKWKTKVGTSDGSYFKYIENDDGSFDIVLRTGPKTKYCMFMVIAQGNYIDSSTFNSLYKNKIEVCYSSNYSDIGACSNIGVSVKSDTNKEYYEIDILDYIDIESLSNMSDIEIEARAENNTLIKTSNNKIYVKALYSDYIDNFIVKIMYYYTTSSKLNNSEKRHTSTIYIHYNEYKQMREKTVQGYTTYYNDSNMNGLIYTHIGDTYTIKTVGGASNTAMQGAVNKDGTIDILNTEYRTQRLSGNDITNKKLTQIEQLIDSGLPVVLSNRLVNVENNKIVSANENTVDNSSNLYSFINKNKNRILYETQVSTNIFYRAFENAIIVNYSELPTQYNSNNDNKYIKNNELSFKFKLQSAVKNNAQTYKVKLYIDINCDGNYSESEEMKGLIATDSSGSSININELKSSNNGSEYTIRKVLSKEYIGAIVWKLYIIDANNENIQTSISGCSAIECKKEDRPVINILQIRSLEGVYHTNANINTHYTDKQYYTFSMQSDKGFNELISNINDFDINIISLKDKNKSTGAGYILGSEDILAYSAQVSVYKDENYTQYISENKISNTIRQYISNEIDYTTFKGLFNNTDDETKLADTVIKSGIKQIFKDGIIESKSSTIVPANSDTEYLRELAGTTTQLELKDDNNIYYIEIYIQGLGMHEIDDIDNGITNLGSAPEVKKFDMIVLGFGQSTPNITCDETLDAVEEYIDSGDSVMLSHDKLLHNYISGSKILIRLREKFGCDRFATNDAAWIPKSNREKIDKTAIGFDDIMFMAHFNTEQYSAGQYNHYSYGASQNDFTKSFGGSFYGNTCATYAKCINRGQITDYPYTLPSRIKVAYTHYQYWQLDLEDPEIGVWYTMTDDSGIRKYAENDARNAYYMYNKGNITYTGVGEWYIGEGITNEKKLFVNTLIQSFKNSAQASKLVVDNSNAQLVGNDVYIYLDEETGASIDTNQKLNFHMQDVNVLSDISLDVTFADIKPEHQNTEVNIRNFDEKTNTIYSDNTGKVYKADTEMPLQADENGRLTVTINDNYYIEIPDNIIEWAKTRITDTQNSYTIYARVRMKYYTKAGSTDESNARSIECIQRIIFVKRDLFMLD